VGRSDDAIRLLRLDDNEGSDPSSIHKQQHRLVPRARPEAPRANQEHQKQYFGSAWHEWEQRGEDNHGR
jgi:hypothetical protein